MSQEIVLLCKTRGNSSPKDKPKVYFTCHPDDFDIYFEKICEDIFKTHDCAIYYTEDMRAEIKNENNLVDLERMNLFVIPVTFHLLAKPNRAMDTDFTFAKEKNIPVLPFMMETGILELYSRPDKFGEIQFLNPYSKDSTEISYEEKLKKYLETVLISDELAQRIRKAFDAYIFLSYRKKDRKQANDLMHLIHTDQECQDIAIWFDEYLTPGESFRDNIDRMLRDSKLFTLLVTPRILETPNFVMSEEYPKAQTMGKEILPAEMEKTNIEVLREKFSGIPECIDVTSEENRERFLESIRRVAVSESDGDPEHNYLIGRAYLEGIDVEINTQRGVELITKAAEAEFEEAMIALYNMYYGGIKVPLDYGKAVHWAQKLVDYYTRKKGEEHQDTLTALGCLAFAYNEHGDYKKALTLGEKLYSLYSRILGDEHFDTMAVLSNLASSYKLNGDYKKALELNEKVYELRCRVLGKEHPDTLSSLSQLASVYVELLDYKKAVEILQKVYTLECQILGEEHPTTLATLNGIGLCYGKLGEYKKALEIEEKVYTLRCRILGEENVKTLGTASIIAGISAEIGEYEKAFDLNEKVCELRCRILGEEHPDTLTTLDNIAGLYYRLNEYDMALEVYERVYSAKCRVLGEKNPDTLRTLHSLALTHLNLGELKEALELEEKVYTMRCCVLGEENTNTMLSLSALAKIYGKMGVYEKALELQEKNCALSCQLFGEEHPGTLKAMNNLGALYYNLGEYTKALKIQEKVYALSCSVLGKEHPNTLKSLDNLNSVRKKLEENPTM